MRSLGLARLSLVLPILATAFGPAPLLAHLNREVTETMNAPEVREKLAADGALADRPTVLAGDPDAKRRQALLRDDDAAPPPAKEGGRLRRSQHRDLAVVRLPGLDRRVDWTVSLRVRGGRTASGGAGPALEIHLRRNHIRSRYRLRR